ncbi:MAG: DUF4349 domain-containing protein [Clostridiales bacterium]|nr:DUF4349 domain-containing protein [Clostridiales bacterium]
MDCKKIHYFASLYIDGMMTDEEKIQFERHCEECKDCKTVLENTRLMTESIKKTSDVSLPSNFSASLRERLNRESKKKKMKFSRMAKSITGLVAVAAVILLFITVATPNLFMQMPDEAMPEESGEKTHATLSASRDADKNEAPTADDMARKEVVEESVVGTDEVRAGAEGAMGMGAGESVDIAATNIDSRKIIFSGSLMIEVDIFDQAYNEVLRLVEVKGGFIQNSNVYYYTEREGEQLKAGNIMLRIPKDSFKVTFDEFKNIGNVIDHGMSGDDVTDRYFDTEAAAINLEIQEERLRSILEKAEKIEDILRIENELSRIRLQINQFRGQLLNLDRHIQMSTIRIDIREVKDLTATIDPIDEGLWGRAVESLRKTINNLIDLFERLFIGLFAVLPIIAIVIIILLPVVIIGKKILKKVSRG